MSIYRHIYCKIVEIEIEQLVSGTLLGLEKLAVSAEDYAACCCTKAPGQGDFVWGIGIATTWPGVYS